MSAGGGRGGGCRRGARPAPREGCEGQGGVQGRDAGRCFRGEKGMGGGCRRRVAAGLPGGWEGSAG